MKIIWTLAAPPSDTLVAAHTPSYTIVGVKVYPSAADGVADAYVFSDVNTSLDNYSVSGNLVTITLPAAALGGFPLTLTATTERAGGQPGDDGPTVTVR